MTFDQRPLAFGERVVKPLRYSDRCPMRSVDLHFAGEGAHGQNAQKQRKDGHERYTSLTGKPRRLALLRLCRDALRSHALEGLGFGIQPRLDRSNEATLSFFVAVLFVVVLRVACHGGNSRMAFL